MTTNEKQYYIYIRSTKERIPCTEEEFHNYYHDIDLFRQRQQYHKQCVSSSPAKAMSASTEPPRKPYWNGRMVFFPKRQS